MEWFLGFDVIAILGIVALMGLNGRRRSTPRRDPAEDSRPQWKHAKGNELLRGTEAARLRTEGKPQPS